MERAQIGNATLFRADARDVLDGLTHIDVILTDPVWPNCPAGLLAGSDDPAMLWAETMDLLPNTLLRLVAVLRRDSDPRFLGSIPERLSFLCTINLPYALPGHFGRVLGTGELAYWFGLPPRFAPGRHLVPGRGPVAQPASRAFNDHPCPRAQAHFDWLVDWCGAPEQTVCDPFMGSGTTGISCAKFGYPFVGIEIDRRYFDLACRRIEQAQRQGDLLACEGAQ